MIYKIWQFFPQKLAKLVKFTLDKNKNKFQCINLSWVTPYSDERVSKGQYNMNLGMLWNPDVYYAILHYTIVIKG
jgi:hypothetical protein